MVKRVSSVEVFFTDMVRIVSSMQDVDNQLTYKEQLFLINCLMFHYEGNDLNDFSRLTKYQINKGFSKDPNDVSVYKNKLGTKKWAITGRNLFTLPPHFLRYSKDTENFEFSINLKLTNEQNNNK